MHKVWKAFLILLLAGIIPFTNPSPSAAESPPEPPYHMGALPSSPEALQAASTDQAARLRDIAATTILPSSVSLESLLPPIADQGSQNSCTAWALAYYYKTAQEKQEHGWAVDTPLHQFSPAYVYNQSNWGGDTGSTVDDAMNVLLQQGVATLSVSPYNPLDYRTKPNAAQQHAASFYRAAKKELLFNGQGAANISVLKAQLASGGIFIVTFPVYAWDDIVRPPTPDQLRLGPIGWHAVAVVGYDEAQQAFKFANSWGPGWGFGGYGWMKYSFVQGWAQEGWTMSDNLGDFNDSDDARLLTAGQPVTGTIDPAEDTDSYNFDATAGQTVTITMTKAAGGLVPRLELYSQDGQMLSEKSSSNGQNAVISSFAVTATGQYEVTAKNTASSGGDYSIELSGVSPTPYRVTIDTLRTLDASKPAPPQRDVFFVGGTVRLQGMLNNQTGHAQTAKMEWTITDPSGRSITRKTSGTLPKGVSKWQIDRPVEVGAYFGVYNYTLTATYAGIRTYLASTYVVAPRVKMAYPNGGEIFFTGENRDLFWNGPDERVNYTVRFSQDGGLTWTTVAEGVRALTTTWQVPALAADSPQNRIQVIGYDDYGNQLGKDISNQPFAVHLLNIDFPGRFGEWKSGDQINILWTEHPTTAAPASIRLFYSLNGGQTWTQIDEVAPNTQTYAWEFPTVAKPRSRCIVKAVMKDASGHTIATDQTGYFSIVP